MSQLTSSAALVQLIQQRLKRGQQRGEEGVLLDGFPRTLAQAQGLTQFSNVQLAVNLHLDEQVRFTRPAVPATPMGCQHMAHACII